MRKITEKIKEYVLAFKEFFLIFAIGGGLFGVLSYFGVVIFTEETIQIAEMFQTVVVFVVFSVLVNPFVYIILKRVLK